MEIPRRTFLGLLGAALGFGGGAALWYGLMRDGSPAATTAVAAPTTTPTTTTTTTTTTTRSPTAPSTTTTAGAPPPSTAAAATTVPTTTTVVSGPAMTIAAVCAEAWGGQPMAFMPETHTIRRLTVHHTAAVLDDNRRAPARARQHQAFHMDAGWADIAYHYLVDRNGHVLAGRDVAFAGDTFTDYDPDGHFLVVAEGNFDVEEPSSAQLQGLADVLAWAAAEFGVGLDTISGHRDHATTACPGDHLYARLGDIRARAAARLRVGGVVLDEVCGGDAAALVAAIEAGTDDPVYET